MVLGEDTPAIEEFCQPSSLVKKHVQVNAANDMYTAAGIARL